MSGKALIKLAYVRRPISQEVIGYRMVAAVPNRAGRKMKVRFGQDGTPESFYATKEEVPSFRKPYLICESSDHLAIGRKEIESFLERLKWEGYEDWEFVGKWDAQPLK